MKTGGKLIIGQGLRAVALAAILAAAGVVAPLPGPMDGTAFAQGHGGGDRSEDRGRGGENGRRGDGDRDRGGRGEDDGRNDRGGGGRSEDRGPGGNGSGGRGDDGGGRGQDDGHNDRGGGRSDDRGPGGNGHRGDGGDGRSGDGRSADRGPGGDGNRGGHGRDGTGPRGGEERGADNRRAAPPDAGGGPEATAPDEQPPVEEALAVDPAPAAADEAPGTRPYRYNEMIRSWAAAPPAPARADERSQGERVRGFSRRLGEVAAELDDAATEALLSSGWTAPAAGRDHFSSHAERVSTFVEIARGLGVDPGVGVMQANFGTPQENGLIGALERLRELRAAGKQDTMEAAALRHEIEALAVAANPNAGNTIEGWEVIDLDVDGNGVVDAADLERLRTDEATR